MVIPIENDVKLASSGLSSVSSSQAMAGRRALTAVESLMQYTARRAALGQAARQRAQEQFSAAVILPKYEALYRRVLSRAS